MYGWGSYIQRPLERIRIWCRFPDAECLNTSAGDRGTKMVSPLVVIAPDGVGTSITLSDHI